MTAHEAAAGMTIVRCVVDDFACTSPRNTDGRFHVECVLHAIATDEKVREALLKAVDKALANAELFQEIPDVAVAVAAVLDALRGES